MLLKIILKSKIKNMMMTINLFFFVKLILNKNKPLLKIILKSKIKNNYSFNDLKLL